MKFRFNYNDSTLWVSTSQYLCILLRKSQPTQSTTLFIQHCKEHLIVTFSINFLQQGIASLRHEHRSTNINTDKSHDHKRQATTNLLWHFLWDCPTRDRLVLSLLQLWDFVLPKSQPHGWQTMKNSSLLLTSPSHQHYPSWNLATWVVKD